MFIIRVILLQVSLLVRTSQATFFLVLRFCAHFLGLCLLASAMFLPCHGITVLTCRGIPFVLAPLSVSWAFLVSPDLLCESLSVLLKFLFSLWSAAFLTQDVALGRFGLAVTLCNARV